MKHPLKRHEALQPLSKEHHESLLLCWKIREGKKKEINPERIKAYTDFYFSSQLRPHFEFEEEEIFSLLGKDHPMVKKAETEHLRLEQLFKQEEHIEKALNNIEKELEEHIWFEEKVLFNEIQTEVSEEKLELLKNKEEEFRTPDPESWSDKFWEKEEL